MVVENNRRQSVSTGKTTDRRLNTARKKHRAKKRKNRLIAVCVTALVAVIGIGVAVDRLFVIRKIEISGGVDYTYTSEQAEETAKSIGIAIGDNLLALDRKNAEANAKYYLPQFDSVQIEFDLPDTLVLKVSEAEPVMYTVVNGRGYVLSEKMRITSVCDDASDTENLGLIRAELSGITKSVAGEFIETANGSDKILAELYAVLKEEGLAADVTAIDVSDKFELSFEYKRRFTVKLGGGENLTVRVRFMESVARELSENDSGVIDVSDENLREWSFKAYSKM